jgi:hypothetical protein
LKLSWLQVKEIRKRHASGETQTSLGKGYGVTSAAISLIVRRINRKKRPYIPFTEEQYKRRRRKLRQTHEYGLTFAQRKALGKKCHICGRKSTGRWRTLHIDHDHKLKQVRGLLCIQCNLGIGCFRDAIKLLKRAIRYLRKYENTR